MTLFAAVTVIVQTVCTNNIQRHCPLEALIQLIVPSFQQPSVGKTFGGNTSDYRACKVSHGLNLPFDDTTEIDGFDNRVKSQYQSVVHQTYTLVDNFLHTKFDERMRWLIQAILTLLAAHQQAEQVRGQVAGQVTNSTVQDDKVAVILDFCSIPRSRKEIQAYLGLTGRNNFNDRYLKSLLASGKLKITIPDKPNSRLQKYVKT